MYKPCNKKNIFKHKPSQTFLYFKIFRGDYIYYYLDAYDEKTSNWLRYINCSRYKREENVFMQQCYDAPHYVTNKDIYPGQELLVYYGDDYATSLDIDVDNYEIS